MRRLIVITLVVSLGWMSWWALGSTALDRSLTQWVEARRAEGWAADVADISVAGFPNRFDTTLTEVRLADPETGVAWSAPFLQLLSLAYRPNEVIAVLPDEHVLSTPVETIAITHDRARGSIFLGASASLPLERSTIVIDGMTLRSTLGWTLALDQGRFATERIAARENAHRVGAELLGLRPSDDMRNALDAGTILPRKIDRLRLDADIGFSQPWDRRAIEVARPQVTDIGLSDLSAKWGDVTFRAAGELVVDADGVPSGMITVKAVEWRRLLDMAISGGLVPEASRNSLERGLGFLAALNGPPDTLDAPLTFEGGLILIGPVPLGPAPRIVIR